MGEYSKYIAPERRAVLTPYSIVDEYGKVVFGTFDKEFKSMDFLKIKRPTSAPQFMNRLRLTLWQAINTISSTDQEKVINQIRQGIVLLSKTVKDVQQTQDME